MTDEPDTRGPAIVVRGSVLSGFKFTGPFESIDDAIEWLGEHTLEGRMRISCPTICLLEEPRTDVMS